MKKLKVKKGSTCMACLECVRACSEAFYKEFDPDKSCIQIVEKKAVRPMACPQCGKCAEACPGHAIDKDGIVDPWQCAVYYNGANGTKNPFMSPDAFSDMDDRLEIIAGEADVTPETARKILDKIFFYPPAQHAYQCSICGRACDMECYVHLEEKGVLKKKFKAPFRKRKVWRFSIDDFR